MDNKTARKITNITENWLLWLFINKNKIYIHHYNHYILHYKQVMVMIITTINIGNAYNKVPAVQWQKTWFVCNFLFSTSNNKSWMYLEEINMTYDYDGRC